MSKVLLTSGCSFSETTLQDKNMWYTWPIQLYRHLETHNNFTEYLNCAMGSQGNGLISRGIIYNVIKLLEKYKPEDILVGVMWSGSNRADYRCYNKDLLSFYKGEIYDGWIENPTGFVEGAEKNWVILNAGWKIEEAQVFYKYFHDYVGMSIYSIEHILRTQLFLKSKGIKYFFCNYVDNNIIDFESSDYQKRKDEVDYLYNEIDFSQYLPVSSEHRWVYENAEDKEDYHAKHFCNGRMSAWIHPQKHHHKAFTEQVIIPWLQNKQYI